MSSAATSLSSFLPAKAFATEEQMRRWKETTLKCVETAPTGLKKQLQLQLEWFHDPSSGEAEYVHAKLARGTGFIVLVLQTHPIPRLLCRFRVAANATVALLLYGLCRHAPLIPWLGPCFLKGPESPSRYRPKYVC